MKIKNLVLRVKFIQQPECNSIDTLYTMLFTWLNYIVFVHNLKLDALAIAIVLQHRKAIAFCSGSIFFSFVVFDHLIFCRLQWKTLHRLASKSTK